MATAGLTPASMRPKDLMPEQAVGLKLLLWREKQSSDLNSLTPAKDLEFCAVRKQTLLPDGSTTTANP